MPVAPDAVRRIIKPGLEPRGDETAVVLTEKATGRTYEVGRVTEGGWFQPVNDADFALSPQLLRSIADLIQKAGK